MQESLIAAINKLGCERIIPDLERIALSAALLVPGAVIDPRGERRSWIGGAPLMHPDDTDWPMAPDGAPLIFMLQVDCSEVPGVVRAANGFPANGLFSVFVSREEVPWGHELADQALMRLRYQQDAADLILVDPPYSTHAPRELAMHVRDTYDGERSGLDEIIARFDIPPAEAGELEEAFINALWEGMPDVFHLMGGHLWSGNGSILDLADCLYHGRSPEESYLGLPPYLHGCILPHVPWQQLFQLHEDDPLGLFWGDAGELNLVIEKSDLERRDFSRVVCVGDSA